MQDRTADVQDNAIGRLSKDAKRTLVYRPRPQVDVNGHIEEPSTTEAPTRERPAVDDVTLQYNDVTRPDKSEGQRGQ